MSAVRPCPCRSTGRSPPSKRELSATGASSAVLCNSHCEEKRRRTIIALRVAAHLVVEPQSVDVGISRLYFTFCVVSVIGEVSSVRARTIGRPNFSTSVGMNVVISWPLPRAEVAARQFEGAEFAVAGPAQVADRRRLAVRPRGAEPPLAHRRGLAEQGRDLRDAVIQKSDTADGSDPDVLAHERDRRRQVHSLVRVDERGQQCAFSLRRFGGGADPIVARRRAPLHRGPRALQAAVGRGDAGLERRRRLRRRPAKDVVQESRIARWRAGKSWIIAR